MRERGHRETKRERESDSIFFVPLADGLLASQTFESLCYLPALEEDVNGGL